MEMEQRQQILHFQVPAWFFRKAVTRVCVWPVLFLHQTEGHVTSKHLRCGWPELRCALSVKYTPDLMKDI